MNRLFDEKLSFKRSVGYICLLTLLVLLFYWEGLGAYLNSQDMWELRWAVDDPHGWSMLYKLWRPVYSVFNRIMYINFGLEPLPYHLASLILYISILLLLYHFYNQLFNNKILSRIMVLLFATFYLHAEVVSRFAENGSLLSTLFGLATLVCFLHYRKTPCLRHYALALLFAILALLSKEVSVCLPFLLLAVDYQISYGAFPPRLPLLKDPRQGLPFCRSAKEGLLPHVPFWLMALAIFAVFLAIPGRPLLPTLAPTSTFTDTLLSLPKYTYWLVIYSLSPCFITDRLTVILAFSIMAGLVWLFYRSTPQRRSFMVSMIACTGFSLLPYTIQVPLPGHLLFSSAFSMPLVALLALEIGTCAYRLEPRLQRYRLSQDRTIASLTLLILLPAIYLNYLEVRQYTKSFLYSGRLTKEIVEGTARILPKGPEESIIYVNLPSTVQSKALLGHSIFVAGAHFQLTTAALDLYCRQHGIARIDFTWPVDEKDVKTFYEDENIKSVYLDLGYERVSLDPMAWYNLTQGPFTASLSAEEFNALSRDRKNRVLFFNPVTNKLVDVSGWSYEQLDASISPYRHRLNL